MKARVKATGEIVNVTSQFKIPNGTCIDSANDVLWVELSNTSSARTWGLGEIECVENMESDYNWEDFRKHAAVAAMQAIISNWHNLDSGAFDEYKISYTAVLCANALIKELESFNGGKPKLRVSKKKKLKVEAKKGE